MTHRHSRRQRGLTILELMVTLAIVAILASVATPSFVGLIQTHRVGSEVNAFVGDLQFARAESIRRGTTVTVCASINGTQCSSASNWHGGWIVFSDLNADATVTSGADVILKVQQPWSSAGSSDTFTPVSGTTSAVTFSRDGFAWGLPGSDTWVLHTVPANSNASQCVLLSLAGHQTVQSPGTGNCT